MRSPFRAIVASLLVGLAATCAGCAGGGGGGGGNGATQKAFVGLWQYAEGSFSFVNCYVTSRSVPLAKSGFSIVDEAGTLVRINPDGCRFTIVVTTSTHAEGVKGEECTVSGVDSLGNPLTTEYRLDSLVMELRPDDSSQMLEVFRLEATQSSSVGTSECEITGNNTLDRGP